MGGKNPQQRLLPRPMPSLVVKFLNNENQDASARQDLEQIIKFCQEFDAKWNEAPTGLLIALSEKINRMLERFSFNPGVGCDEAGPFVFWRHTSPLDIGQIILQQVLAMLEDRTLGRIRKCFCDRWFYAQTNKKSVCSDACRFRKFKGSDPEAFRQERAAYMREYRDNPKVRAKDEKKRQRPSLGSSR